MAPRRLPPPHDALRGDQLAVQPVPEAALDCPQCLQAAAQSGLGGGDSDGAGDAGELQPGLSVRGVGGGAGLLPLLRNIARIFNEVNQSLISTKKVFSLSL